jgi:hypothetical protein
MKAICFLGLLCLTACTSHSQLGNIQQGQASTQTESEPQIGFFTFSIDHTGNGTRISLISRKTAKGIIKDNTPYISNPMATLTADFYDHDQKINSVTIDHPLHKVAELPKEGESVMEPLKADLDSTTFFIRLPVKGMITDIRFTETINKKQTLLNTIKL